MQKIEDLKVMIIIFEIFESKTSQRSLVTGLAHLDNGRPGPL